MATAELVIQTPSGLYCPAGGFHIDPSRRVERAIITHAHSDHARIGSERYLTCDRGVAVLRARLGAKIAVQGLDYGETLTLGGVRVSLHPAGHILGSCQVRIESRGEVWVVSGDYKTHADPTCDGIEVVPCHTFITESTFGLPVYRWEEPVAVVAEINQWWRENAEARRASVLFTYSLGKAQRLLALLDSGIGPIYVHPAIAGMISVYRSAGVPLPEVLSGAERLHEVAGRGLVLTPPSGRRFSGLEGLGAHESALVSGWELTRTTTGAGRGRRGFVLSDHADWPGLLGVIRGTGASRVGVGHGFAAPLCGHLRELGYEAWTIPERLGLDERNDWKRGAGGRQRKIQAESTRLLWDT